jgi:hypothetical protein
VSNLPYRPSSMAFWDGIGSQDRVERNIILKPNGRYTVYVRDASRGSNGKRYVGTYSTVEEARKARDDNE